jgi:ATP-dependent DNA helicase RecG
MRSYNEDMRNDDAALLETLYMLSQRCENELVEFKEAKGNYDTHKLGQYFSAISNEANLKNKQYGWLIFGVQDKDHKIVGTNYKNTKALENLKQEISEKTTGGITFMDIFEVYPEVDGIKKRVLMFKIPAAATAMPTGWRNRYYGRNGESLSELTLEEIDRIRRQKRQDWSKQIVPGSLIAHLDQKALTLARDNYKKLPGLVNLILSSNSLT